MQTDDSIERMLKQETSILVDEKLRLDPKQPLHLFLQISDRELDAALFSPKKNTFLAFATTPGDHSRIGSFLQETGLLQLGDVRQSRILITTPVYTLVPSGLYKAEDASEILALHFGGSGKNSSQAVRCIDAHLLFRMPDDISEQLNKLPASQLAHPLAAVLEAFFLQHKNREGVQVLLNRTSGFADIVVKRDRKLLLANTFSSPAPADVLYHVLNVYEQLRLNPEQDPLVLAGEITKEGALYRLLREYFPDPELAARPAVADYSYIFDSLASHSYYSLFSQVLCES